MFDIGADLPKYIVYPVLNPLFFTGLNVHTRYRQIL